MKIVFVYSDNPGEMNCSIFNALAPAEAINKLPNHHADCIHIEYFKQNDGIVQQLCSEADIIVVERNLFDDTLPAMMYWKVRGKSLATIFDDGYSVMSEDNVAYNFWHKNIAKIRTPNGGEKEVARPGIPVLTQFKWGLKMSKGIICPSRILCDDWKEYNKTYRTYNYLRPDRYENKTPLFPHPKDEIYIGWSGSMSHLKSYNDSGIAGALTYILKNYPKVKVLLTGDKRVYSRINIAEDRKIFTGYVPEDNWSQLIASLDIGLAPLASTFDHRRSWIKCMEYMIMGIPWVASNFETYEELGDYGLLVENSLKGWRDAISYSIENIEERRKLAKEKAYEYAMTKTWDGNIDKLLSIFQEIIKSKYEYEND